MEKKAENKEYQVRIAKILYEMGMDFDVVEKISGVDPYEFLVNYLNTPAESVDKKENLSHNELDKKVS